MNPKDIARRSWKNSAKAGDRVVYRDPVTRDQSDFEVVDVTRASDGVNVVYLGSGRRVVHSRHVVQVVVS